MFFSFVRLTFYLPHILEVMFKKLKWKNKNNKPRREKYRHLIYRVPNAQHGGKEDNPGCQLYTWPKNQSNEIGTRGWKTLEDMIPPKKGAYLMFGHY